MSDSLSPLLLCRILDYLNGTLMTANGPFNITWSTYEAIDTNISVVVTYISVAAESTLFLLTEAIPLTKRFLSHTHSAVRYLEQGRALFWYGVTTHIIRAYKKVYHKSMYSLSPYCRVRNTLMAHSHCTDGSGIGTGTRKECVSILCLQCRCIYLTS